MKGGELLGQVADKLGDCHALDKVCLLYCDRMWSRVTMTMVDVIIIIVVTLLDTTFKSYQGIMSENLKQ
jgi:hypothetical protein